MVRKHPELELLYAIPNAGKRPVYVGAKMKAEGLLPGMPDMCLPISRGGFNNLFVELKVGKNKPSPNQIYIINKLNEFGNLAVVCYGQDQVKAQLLEYINLET